MKIPGGFGFYCYYPPLQVQLVLIALVKPLSVSGLEKGRGSTRLFVMVTETAKFKLGQVVRHRTHPFRGVVFDVDPEFSNSEDWWLSIPEELRPRKEQPYYHLLAENTDTTYVAYVSEQNLLPDGEAGPVNHPQLGSLFGELKDGVYQILNNNLH